jgi:hypothetical protein
VKTLLSAALPAGNWVKAPKANQIKSQPPGWLFLQVLKTELEKKERTSEVCQYGFLFYSAELQESVATNC